MKSIKKHNLLCRVACAILAVGVICQANTPEIYASEQHDTTVSVSIPASYSLKDEFSKNGNPVTEYENMEDNQLKTILWTQGIVPPKMGGTDSQFKREIVYDNNRKPVYIDYISPYLPNQGWYDVNKSTNFEQNDVNLCFAAAAANSLHWWMDQNANYIDRYLEKNADNQRIQKLKDLRVSYEDQQHSGVYNIFRDQFRGKPDGYWSDLLQEQFLNGYYLNSSGGTNDSDIARDKLLNNGPDQHGGFFYELLNVNRLTQRRYYDLGFDALNREIKELLLNGNLLLMTYTTTGNNAHVVTLWGAEYDSNGNICAVYFTDSDDPEKQGMVRYRIVNIGGKPAVTTRTDGKSSNYVTCLQILSPGTEKWKSYFNESSTVLNLQWRNTDLTYNGQEQAPTVIATNIKSGDDVKVTAIVEGSAVNAGSYTATAKLSGKDADKYELPQDRQFLFEIKKAKAPTIEYPSAGPLEYGQKLLNSSFNGGSTEYGHFDWADSSTVPTVNNSGYLANFVPSENTKQNYELPNNTSQLIPVTVSKGTSAIALNAKVSQNEGTNSVDLIAKLTNVGDGKLPTGTVNFVVRDENGVIVADNLNNVLIQDGVARANWSEAVAKEYTVNATYTGDENYNAVSSADLVVNVNKQSQVGFEIAPIDTKTYGDQDFTLYTSGGNGTGAVTYESSDPSVISIFGDTACVGNAGTATITAKKAGDSIYNETVATASVVVNKQELKIIADSFANIVQGDAIPSLTYTVEGLVNADQLTDVQLTISIENTEVPGDYPIIAQGGNLTNAQNYNITYVNGMLSIKEKESNPTDPVEPPKPIEPTDPVEPPKPIVPTDPTKPQKPIIPTNPTKPPKPIVPTNPSKPAEISIPSNSTETTNSTENRKVRSSESIKHPVAKEETKGESKKENSSQDRHSTKHRENKNAAKNSSKQEINADSSMVTDEKNGIGIGVKIVIGLVGALGVAEAVVIVIRKKKENRRKRLNNK